jgi:hypothetical protein
VQVGARAVGGAAARWGGAAGASGLAHGEQSLADGVGVVEGLEFGW